MSVSEDRRIAVLEAASHHWGRDVAVTLMEMLPPSGWGDVATRQQLDALGRELRAESIPSRGGTGRLRRTPGRRPIRDRRDTGRPGRESAPAPPVDHRHGHRHGVAQHRDSLHSSADRRRPPSRPRAPAGARRSHLRRPGVPRRRRRDPRWPRQSPELRTVVGAHATAMSRSFWVPPEGFERRSAIVVDPALAFPVILETGWPVTPGLGLLLELTVECLRVASAGRGDPRADRRDADRLGRGTRSSGRAAAARRDASRPPGTARGRRTLRHAPRGRVRDAEPRAGPRADARSHPHPDVPRLGRTRAAPARRGRRASWFASTPRTGSS